MSKEFLWVEKYRPNKIDDCVLPDRIKSMLKQFVDQKNIPNMILSGPAGCGKTTSAIAMCEEVGCDYLFMNSSDERGINHIRSTVIGYASTVSLMGGSKVVILDEADGLTTEAQDALRGIIEKYSVNCTFILTCNFKARLIDAIHSRCPTIDFTLKSKEKPLMASKMFKRLENILKTEEITYDKQVLIRIVEKYFPDYRRTLGELQGFAASGNIDVGILSQLDGIRAIKELVKSIKEKDFSGMRKWVVLNSDVDQSRIYRNIYDGLNEYLKPESIPATVVTLAKYQYQSAFVADPELNLVACLTEIMVDAEIK